MAYCPAVESESLSFEQGTARTKVAAQMVPSSMKAASYHDMLEGVNCFLLTSQVWICKIHLKFKWCVCLRWEIELWVHAVGIPFFPSLIQNSNQMAVIPDSTTFLQHMLTCQHSTNCFLLMLLWFTEEMVQGLQQVSWQKVDVSFHSALWPFLAHGAIHVSSFEPWHYIESLFDLLSDLSTWFGVWSLRGVDWSWIAGEAQVAALWGSWCDCPCCWDLEATGVMCVFGGKLVMQQTKRGLCTQCPDLGCGSWQAWGIMSCIPTRLLPAKYSITWVFCSLGNLTLLIFLL